MRPSFVANNVSPRLPTDNDVVKWLGKCEHKRPISKFNVNKDINNVCFDDQTRHRILLRGYHISTKLTNTLQGSIWRGITSHCDLSGQFNRHIVIKVANKYLSSTKSAFVNGRRIFIKENILQEMKILKYLTRHGISFGLNQFIVNCIDFFQDESKLYLVMEHGGVSLFDLVMQSHQLISSNRLTIFEWQNICKILFKKMITFIYILHNRMNVCHLDISLENILVKDIIITADSGNKDIVHFVPNFTVKFCDFGLSEMFDNKANPHFICNKWVGKTSYQAPEIYLKKHNFNAKAADIWSIGVCLFAMLAGSMPFKTPAATDPSYQWVISGHILQLLKQWKKVSYITSQSLDVLSKIFKTEDKRIKSKRLLSHTWFQHSC